MVNHFQRALFGEAVLQPQHNAEFVAIRNLYNDHELYNNYPRFQRGYVWPEKFKLALIDSILRGSPIHPLLTQKKVGEDGKEKYWIIDGQQRLSTIYEFMRGGFKTPTKSKVNSIEPNKFEPIEPGRYFQELSERARNIFCSYKFIVNVIDGDASDDYIEMLFRRIQHQLPLNASEKLSAYTSAVRDFASRLQDHPIWSDFYTGPNKRKEEFQGSVMLLILEHMQGYVSLKSDRLHDFASGAKDKQISQETYDAVESRLDVITHVFHDITFRNRSAIIPMYQAVMFLEKQGYTFTSSDKGCLTSWLAQVLCEADGTGLRGFNHPITELRNINQQHDFWDVHLPRIIEILKQQRNAA